jgi:hypothetical protein
MVTQIFSNRILFLKANRNKSTFAVRNLKISGCPLNKLKAENIISNYISVFHFLFIHCCKNNKNVTLRIKNAMIFFLQNEDNDNRINLLTDLKYS